MTRELAKNILVEHIKLMEQENDPSLKEDIDALKMAIQALSQVSKIEESIIKYMKKYPNHVGNTDFWEGFYACRNVVLQLDDEEYAPKEQEPCEDAISRDAVNTLVDELARAISDERCHIPQRGRDTGHIMHDILDLPSVTQKSDNKYRKEAKRWKNKWLKSQKSGHWIQLDYQRGKFECSECHTQGYVDTCMYEPTWKYCPNCGAEMESEE